MPDSHITKRALAESMKELMLQRPFAKISVSDICTHCGMSRKSFYYHFQDKYDLVHWIFESEFVQTVSLDQCADDWDYYCRLCNYLYQEREFYRRALQIQGQNSVRDVFYEVFTPIVVTMVEKLFSDEEEAPFYIDFFGDAFLASILRWLSAPEPEQPEVYLERMHRLVVNASRFVLSELKDHEAQRKAEGGGPGSPLSHGETECAEGKHGGTFCPGVPK